MKTYQAEYEVERSLRQQYEAAANWGWANDKETIVKKALRRLRECLATAEENRQASPESVVDWDAYVAVYSKAVRILEDELNPQNYGVKFIGSQQTA